jgi:hypothetical protein
MAELCGVDGGATVFKRVELPAGEYDLMMKTKLPVHGEVVAGRYAYKEWSEQLATAPEHRLTLGKLVETYSDLKTGETLGQWVYYYRRGGDGFSINNTSNGCPEKVVMTLRKAVFIRGVQ